MISLPPFVKNILSCIASITGKVGKAGSSEVLEKSKEENIETSYSQLSQKYAEDIMIPRAEIRAICSKLSLEDLIKEFQKTGHSRLPVYYKTLDTICGMVHIKDILPYVFRPKEFLLTQSIRKVLFASPAAKLNELLLDMQQSHTHMALIVDEHGGIDGLITIEDILEELVGEIRDEHEDPEEPLVTKTTDTVFLANGKAPIELVESSIKTKFPDIDREEVETIAGYISCLHESVPKTGDTVIVPKADIHFKVLKASPRTVDRIMIQLPSKETV